jgi:hypothetical protein
MWREVRNLVMQQVVHSDQQRLHSGKFLGQPCHLFPKTILRPGNFYQVRPQCYVNFNWHGSRITATKPESGQINDFPGADIIRLKLFTFDKIYD